MKPISIEEALTRIRATIQPAAASTIPLDSAVGHVLAEPIYADRDYPPFDRAMMDGFALSAADFQARPPGFAFQVSAQAIFAGQARTAPVVAGECVRIMTGAPLPPGTDCVIPLEESESGARESRADERQTGERLAGAGLADQMRFPGTDRPAVRPGRFVAPQGEDAGAGERVLAAGTRINAGMMNVLASLGVAQVPVRRLPSVCILSTGDEIVAVDAPAIRPEQIRDSNYYSLLAGLAAYRIAPPTHRIVRDDPAALAGAIEEGLQADLLILTGGVSMGDADLVPGTLARAGVQEIFHRVDVKPGRPLWFGRRPASAARSPDAHDTVVFGLPGNPVSCQVGWKIFIEPWLRGVLGQAPAPVWRVPLAADSGGRRKAGPRPEFFPARLGNGPAGLQLLPLRSRSSGDIRATADAEGLGLHPGDRAELTPGELVEFYPD